MQQLQTWLKDIPCAWLADTQITKSSKVNRGYLLIFMAIFLVFFVFVGIDPERNKLCSWRDTNQNPCLILYLPIGQCVWDSLYAS